MTADLCKSQLKEEEFLSLLPRIMEFKDCQQDLLDLMKSDVPFSYKHLLSISVFLTLLCLAYGMALSESSLAPGLFVIMELVLLGMLDVSAELWNPFRSKNLEPTLELWKQDFLTALRTILNYQHDGAREQWRSELEEEHSANPNFLAFPDQLHDFLEGSRRLESSAEEHPRSTPDARTELLSPLEGAGEADASSVPWGVSPVAGIHVGLAKKALRAFTPSCKNMEQLDVPRFPMYLLFICTKNCLTGDLVERRKPYPSWGWLGTDLVGENPRLVKLLICFLALLKMIDGLWFFTFWALLKAFF